MILSAPVPNSTYGSECFAVGGISVGHRDQHPPADEVGVSFVFQVDAHGCIAKDGLRPGSRHGQVLSPLGGYALHVVALDDVLEVVQLALILAAFHLEVADGRHQSGGPVDHVHSPVHQSALVCENSVFELQLILINNYSPHDFCPGNMRRDVTVLS